MFFLLSKILDIAFSPLTWAMVLIAAGTALALRKPTRRRVWGDLLGGGLAVLHFFSIEPVANVLWRSLESPPLTTLRSEVTYDAVILLGGMVEVHATEGRDQIAFNDNVERMLATYDLLRTGRAQRMILSGGSPDPKSVFALEATSASRQLEAWGIAKERIVVESRVRNTHENAVESARLARENGWESLLVVTSAFHNLEPEAYLRDVLRVLAHWPRDRYLELCPHLFAATRARLDPVELAQEVGHLTVPPAITTSGTT